MGTGAIWGIRAEISVEEKYMDSLIIEEALSGFPPWFLAFIHATHLCSPE